MARDGKSSDLERHPKTGLSWHYEEIHRCANRNAEEFWCHLIISKREPRSQQPGISAAEF